MAIAPCLSASAARPLIARHRLLSVGRASRYAGLSMFKKPFFENEPSPNYSKGSPQREAITHSIRVLKSKLPVRILLTIAGRTAFKPELFKQLNPSRHKEVIAEWTSATKDDVHEAINAALGVKPTWENLPFQDRASISLGDAELVSGKYRYEMTAATMLGQGKNIHQAEIDAAAETVDLLRFYVQCAMDLFAQQPAVNLPAISPFNFTTLGANLVAAPALMGNVVIWKPSLYALHSSWLLYKILLEAGNVIQFVPGDAEEITEALLESPHFAALNFTGSTKVFKSLWGKIGKATAEDNYLSYPRIVSETEGKNFHIIHGSADIENAINNTIRGAFEYQGQKRSATSRIYVAESIWPEFKKILIEKTETIRVGPPENYENYVNAVIHEDAFDRLTHEIEKAVSDPTLTHLAGGKASKQDGYFVHPTIYQTMDPRHELMKRELFGPIVLVYVFPDAEWLQTLKTIDTTTSYGLTGNVFARDQRAIHAAETELRHSAGNFYINTKSSGSVVAQQSFE